MEANQKGFSAVEILVIIVIVGLLGAVGWLVHDRQKSKALETTNTSSTQANTAKKEETPKQETTKSDPNAGYLVVKEWGLRFRTPSGLTDVRYAINSDTAAFFARPSDSSVQYRADYNKYTDGHFQYATGLLYRSTNATNNERGFPTDGKKVGSYYYYTAWSFSGLATGAACVELYGDSSESNCQAEGKAFQLINQGDSALLNTIELAR